MGIRGPFLCTVEIKVFEIEKGPEMSLPVAMGMI